MSTDPNKERIKRNLAKMREQGATDDEVEHYLGVVEGLSPVADDAAMHAAPTFAPSPKSGRLNAIASSLVKATPFAKEIGSALGAAPYLLPGGKTFSDEYGENVAANEAAQEAALRDQHGLTTATTLAARAPQLFLPGGPALSSGIISGLTSAAEADGSVLDRAKAGAIGAGVGAGVGWAGGKVLGLGATKALAALGGAAGAANSEGGVGSRAIGAATGAAGGAAIGRFGGAAAGKAITKSAEYLKRASPALSTSQLGMAEVAKALGREGTSLIELLERKGATGDILADAGKPGGPVQRLTETVLSYPAEGSAQLGKTIASRAAFSPPAAEKAARKALGSRFSPRNPIAQEAKREISRASAPAYAKLKGQTVDSPALRQFLKDEPLARDAFERGRELASKRLKAGKEAEEIPPFFADVDGTIVFNGDEVPVQAVSYMKRGLRSLVERRRNSQNPIDSEEAGILSERLDDVVNEAKKLRPDYADADRIFGEVAEEQTGRLTHRRQLRDYTQAGSQTARRLKGQDDFETGGFSLNDLNPNELLKRAASSGIGRRMAGWNEQKADATAQILGRDLSSTESQVEFARELVDYLRKLEQQQNQIATVSRAASLGIGHAVGHASQDRERRGKRRPE